MGQSSSRARLPATTPPNPASDTNNVRSSSNNPTRVERTVQPDSQRAAEKKRSRRQSVRQSFLSLVSRSHSSSTPSPPPSPPPSSEPSHSRRPFKSFRKSWRQSKRFSRASHIPPSRDIDISAASGAPNYSEVDDNLCGDDNRPKPGPSTTPPLQNVSSRSSRPSTPFPVSRSTTPHAELPELSTEGLSERERQLSQNIGAWLSGAVPPPSSSSLPHGAVAAENIEQEIHDFLNSETHTDREATSSAQTGPSQSTTVPTTEANTAPPQPPRHFPPPGTLVVVQGVVNTTDAPHSSNTSRQGESTSTSTPVRPRASSLPRSNHRPEERSRTALSSLLPRPQSMISNRASADVIPPNTAGSETFDALSSGSSSTSEDSSRSGDTQETTPNSSETGHRALSPGSIDVLGTLLRYVFKSYISYHSNLDDDTISHLLSYSVAATATAASLFSPSLAQVTSTASTTTTHPLPGHATERPTSPTPTAGLGSLGGLGGLPLNLSSPGSTPGDRDARERIRNVWDSFRDRLGLHSRAPTSGGGSANDGLGGANPNSTTSSGPGQSHSNNNNTSSPTDNGRMRPGELMLAEMARALNAGLGLNNNQGASSSSNHTQAQNTERRPGAAADDHATDSAETPANVESNGNDARIPNPLSEEDASPEAGFERFLLNLQADLRTILSTDLSGLPAATSTPETQSSSRTSGSASEEQDTEVIDSVQVPSDDVPIASNSTSPPPLVHVHNHDHEVEDQEDFAGLPHLESDSETESESDDDESMHEVDENVPPPRTPTPIPRSHLQQPPRHTDNDWGTDEHGRPTINLWRIYRFQPIPAPYSPTQATTPTPAPPTSTTSAQAEASPRTSESSASESRSTIPNEHTVPPPTSEEVPPPNGSGPGLNLNVVVPVIVVGLQSVDTGHDRDQDDDWLPPHHHHHHLRHHIPTPSDGSTATTTSTSSTQTGPTIPSTSSFPGSTSGSSTVPRINTSEESPLSALAAGATPTPRPGTPRSRTWQARAANAFRTLRPGRRGGSGRTASDANWSRTFLIYVIGGKCTMLSSPSKSSVMPFTHVSRRSLPCNSVRSSVGYYPPNHHMVTGSDSLDSYEALWSVGLLSPSFFLIRISADLLLFSVLITGSLPSCLDRSSLRSRPGKRLRNRVLRSSRLQR